MNLNTTIDTIRFIITAAIFSLALFPAAAMAQSTAFSYQGHLNDGASAANGNYDFEFRLFNSVSGGNEIGSVNARSGVAVEDGTFAVTLDFGAGFPGAARYLEIRVRSAGGGGFTTLDPRQKVDSAPYALQSLNAANAENAENAVNAQNAVNAETAVNAQNAANAVNANTAANALQLGGVAANQYVVTTDPRLSDARPPAPGSGSYIQNASEAQPGANFNISGNGTAAGTLSGNVVHAITQFNLGNSRVLTALNGIGTTIVGIGAGLTLPTNPSTSPLGDPIPGQDSSFFGARSGRSNTTGYRNSYFGYESGLQNTAGHNNAFFGALSGTTNSIGSSNSFFGSAAGFGTTSGSLNTFVGLIAGVGNSVGNNNTIVGAQAGFTSSSNGSNNVLLGWTARVASDINNAGAIGARAIVTTSDSLVLGSINGINNATADTNVGIGTTSPNHRLHIGVNNSHITFGSFGCSSGFAGIAIGSATPNCLSYSLLSDGTDTMLNVPSGGSILFRVGNITRASFSSSGVLALPNLGTAGATHLCRNASGQVSTCSSPLTEASEEMRSALEKQQADIDELRNVIERQRLLIDALRQSVCGSDPKAAICMEVENE